MLAKGSPNQELYPKAAEAIYKQVKNVMQIQRTKQQLATALKNYTNDPTVLKSVISTAMRNSNPVDSSGRINSDVLKEWLSYANPYTVAAASRGRDFLPMEVTNRKLEQKQQQNNSMSPSGMVRVISSSGNEGFIPADRLNEAIKKGFRRA